MLITDPLGLGYVHNPHNNDTTICLGEVTDLPIYSYFFYCSIITTLAIYFHFFAKTSINHLSDRYKSSVTLGGYLKRC